MRGDLRRGVAGLPGGGLRRASASRSIFSAINYYTRSVTRFDAAALARAGGAPCGRSAHAYTETGWEVYPAGAHRHAGLGEGAVRRPPALRHRERRRLLRSAHGRGRGVEDPLRVDYLREHLRAARDGDRPRASTCAATSPGRCSTTSNGASASPSASASSTSTSRRRSARPKASARFYAEVIRTGGAILDAGSAG